MKKLKMIEWNIHGCGGYANNPLPSIICDTVLAMQAELVILTEFRCNAGWDAFAARLEKTYALYLSPYVSEGYNQVLIALDKKVFLPAYNLETVNPADAGLPEFLRVDAALRSTAQTLSVIGLRMKQTVANRDKIRERDFLKQYLAAMPQNIPVICGGDFNVTADNLDFIPPSFWVVTPAHQRSYYNTPRYIDNYSYLFTNRRGQINDKKCLDHFITNCRAKYAAYTWDFIEKEKDKDKTYPSRQELLTDDVLWKIPPAYPDHAVLQVTLEIEEAAPGAQS